MIIADCVDTHADSAHAQIQKGGTGGLDTFSEKSQKYRVP